MIDPDLQQLAQSLTGPFAFCGIGVQQGGNAATFGHHATHPAKADENTLFRVASLSKIVTGAVTLAALRRMGFNPSSPIDASEFLGFPLRHYDTDVTVQMLAGHTAGLRDFVVPPDIDLASFFNADVFDARPGATFSYSNAGYVLLAAIAEQISGQGFEHLTADSQKIHAIAGGFNWFGVDENAQILATYRLADGQFIPQIDAPRASAPDGINPARWSPQGGLRTSLRGMTNLAATLRNTPHDPIWLPHMGSFDTVGGAYESYGWGVQIFDKPTFYPRPLIGHFGNAYGFIGGAWYDAQTDTAFSYGLNGRAMGCETDDITAPERQIFDHIAAL